MPLSDYTPLIDWLKSRQIPGDIVEIGALIGNGTKQLAGAFPYKVIHAVDTFDNFTDDTKNQAGVPMWQFYESECGGRAPFELFQENLKGCQYMNVKPFVGRSIEFTPPEDIFLAIIDGSHSPDVAKIDFEKVRHAKYVAFHDYRHDLPELTRAIDEMTEGLRTHVLPGWCIVCN